MPPAARRTVGAAATRFLAVIMIALLAMSMLPAAGLQGASAYADEPAERPATSGGDVALQGANGAGDATAATVPVAEEREGGMLATDGLLYGVADGGLALVGFDEAAAEDGAGAPALAGALSVPAAVSVDGRDVAVVAIDLAEGSVAEGVTALSVPQSIKHIEIETLASAFPSLASVEVASAQGSTLPVAAGAAAMRATYSSFGGALLGQATVKVQNEDGTVEPVQCRELLWAPPAAAAVRLPVDCLSVAPGALVDAKSLETIVCFGDVQRIATAERDEAGNVAAEGALTDEQLSSVTVVFPDATPAVPSDADERVSASMALNDGATQTDKRHAWVALGLPLERLSMGKPVGALTETVAVGDDGAIGKTDLELISYPGMHPRATDVKHPDESGDIDMADSGLAFEMKSDMTLSVRWQGDVTATPAHLEIPAYVAIDNVTYPVTEIAEGAFEGAVFLTSVDIPEGVVEIGEDAFKDCRNLVELTLPSALKATDVNAFAPGLPGLVASNEVAASSNSLSFAEAASLAQGVGGGTASSDSSQAERIEAYGSDSYIFNIMKAEGLVSVSFPSQVNILGGPTDCGSYYEYSLRSNVANLSYIGISCVSRKSDTEFWLTLANGLTYSGANGYPVELMLSPGYRLVGVNVGASTLGTCNGLGTATATMYPFGTEITVLPIVVRDTDAAFAPYAKTVDIQKWVDDNYLTKAATDLDNFYDKAQFNTISYAGLEEADFAGALPTFYVSDAGKLPTVPEPRRDGFGFKGWTWAGQGTPTKDPSAAFAGGGPVVLTANWEEAEPETPEARYFFTEEAPLRHDDASERQTHVIKVRLSNVARTLASVSFEGNDKTGLLRDTGGVELYVGAAEDVMASGTKLSWGGSTGSGWSTALAKFGDDSWGLYVGISIPTAAIDEASVPSSYTDGSYVASLVKMNYAFA